MLSKEYVWTYPCKCFRVISYVSGTVVVSCSGFFIPFLILNHAPIFEEFRNIKVSRS